MPLTLLLGHQPVRERLSSAIVAGKLPQVLLVTGPRGVGKQRLGLWLAERLLCEVQGSEPCGSCVSCKRVRQLVHPDVHWLVPIPRPKATEPDKQVEEAGQLLEAAMAERRELGRWTAPDGMSSHGIASARLLQRRATLSAAEGSWRVFIIGRAERLVPQESSPAGANALLKLLEEPPAKSVFVLTTAEPGLVLPTIRSRAVPLRIGRIEDSEVRSWAKSSGLEFDDQQIASARGSIGNLLSADAPEWSKAKAGARTILDSLDRGPEALAQLALKQGVAQARGDFTMMLDALAEELLAEAHKNAQKLTGPNRTKATLAAIEQVQETRELAQGNVNPQLALAALLANLEATCA